jgi:hypothetical protein
MPVSPLLEAEPKSTATCCMIFRSSREPPRVHSALVAAIMQKLRKTDRNAVCSVLDRAFSHRTNITPPPTDEPTQIRVVTLFQAGECVAV